MRVSPLVSTLAIRGLVALTLGLAACSPGVGSRAPLGVGEAATTGPTAGSTAGPGTQTGSGGQPARLEIDPSGSEARYRAQEVLAQLRVPTEAIGRTSAVSGSLSLDSSGRVAPAESVITVDLRRLQSDQRLRDRFIQDQTLETSQYPMAELVVREVRGLPWPLPEAGQVTFELAGDLTVHGVTRPTTWQGAATLAGDQVTGNASTRVRITDFGMEIPRVAALISLEDELVLEVDIRGTRR